MRDELCAEAIRLGRLLRELLPGEPEVTGLLALMLLTDVAPRGADDTGRRSGYVLPNRIGHSESRRITEGLAHLREALGLRRLGPSSTAGGDPGCA